MKNSAIPKQEIGNRLDLSSTIELGSIAEAISFFEIAKHRLLAVNRWDKICMAPSSIFKLIDHKNQPILGLVKEGDYIKINIPGPGTKIGNGYDWVRVEQIFENRSENEELISITVRPTHHPLRKNAGIAHFFQHKATSTFQIKRYGTKVEAAIHGRNELTNNKKVGLFDRLRNTVVAWFAKLGFSYPQWKLLLEGLIKN